MYPVVQLRRVSFTLKDQLRNPLQYIFMVIYIQVRLLLSFIYASCYRKYSFTTVKHIASIYLEGKTNYCQLYYVYVITYPCRNIIVGLGNSDRRDGPRNQCQSHSEKQMFV